MPACNLLAVALAFSSVGARMTTQLPVVALVGFQAFRLLLEVVLHRLHVEGVIPVTMTWGGPNLDVLTGVLALAGHLVLFRALEAR